jgi:hypothetical protein
MKSLVREFRAVNPKESNLFITVLLRSNGLASDTDVGVMECIDLEIARRERYFPIGWRDWGYGISALNICPDSGAYHSEVNDQMDRPLEGT